MGAKLRLCLAVFATLATLVQAKVNDGWGPWGHVGQCSVSCGGGEMISIRECNLPGHKCSGSGFKKSPCNTQSCQVNGGWGPWGKSKKCSVSCGGGKTAATRVCNNPAPSNGGQPCSGSAIKLTSCNTQPCSVNGAWGPWRDLGQCDVSCGSGKKTSVRACNNPAPSNGGQSCSGPGKKTTPCNTKPCVNGGWSSWGKWSRCSNDCRTTRSRACNNPTPSIGGDYCRGLGELYESCKESCKVNGGWSSWSNWGVCSKSCGTGAMMKSRACNNPSPRNGGRPCRGVRNSIKSCNTQSCPD